MVKTGFSLASLASLARMASPQKTLIYTGNSCQTKPAHESQTEQGVLVWQEFPKYIREFLSPAKLAILAKLAKLAKLLVI